MLFTDLPVQVPIYLSISVTKRHSKTTVEEYLRKDNNSQILKHLQENSQCRR